MPDFVLRNSPRSYRALALVILAAACCLGCAKSVPKGTVEGKVTLNDQPYSDAAVVFLDFKTGQAGAADIQAGGKFQLKDPLPVGTYKIYLAPKVAGASADPAPVKIDQSVPDQYWNESTSPLSADVVAGKNDIPVKLAK